MALKKKSPKSKGEQLYMLEVIVDQVKLNTEIENSDVNIEDLLVSVRFADLPDYEIHISENTENCDQDPKPSDGSNDSKSRKSCIFAKTPSCLIKAIRWSPMYIELYRKNASCTKKNFFGTVRVTLPTCMCNHVAATQNKTDGLSTACTVKDTYELTDHQGNVSGTVTVMLRLSCFGSSIIKQFSLSGKSFMLEDSPLQKLLCSYMCPNREMDTEGSKEDDKPMLKRPDSPPRISMDDPAFKTLTTAEKLNYPKYRELVYSAYPDEPTCTCMPTNRSGHPMECRSGCTNHCCMNLRNPMILTKDERHVDDILANTYCVNNTLSALYALKQHDSLTNCNNPKRMRGGGDIEQIYVDPSCLRWSDYDTDHTWYEEKYKPTRYEDNYNFNPGEENRLEGGGEESCSCSGSPVLVPPRVSPSKEGHDVVAVFDACEPRVMSTGATPGCICPGKDPKWPRGAAKCMKSPCMGIDCLIRAFKEAQEFVDSIGKVPGLPGLGLMDPSESPYFGRDVDKDYVPQERPVERKKATGMAQAPTVSAPTCTAPCSIMNKPVDDIRPPVSPYAPPVPRGVTVPPRLGIVREAIPVLPEVGSTITSPKHRKKEEKKDEKTDKKELDPTASAMESEMGPCGEPRCKSRRRKATDDGSVTQSATHVSSKTRIGGRRINARKALRKPKKAPKIHPKKRSPKAARGMPSNHSAVSQPLQRDLKMVSAHDYGKTIPKKQLGPGGDRSFVMQSAHAPTIPVSRRVMKYVYFVGDYYPGTNYGHRNCIEMRMRVPANMGWLWTTTTTAGKLKPRIGWRPGAIGRYLYEMLQDAKENSFAMEEPDYDTTDRKGRVKMDRARKERIKILERARSAPPRPLKTTSRRQRTGRTMSFQSMQKQSQMEGEEEGPEPPPTLHIHRKDGTYYVTMYPIRQETSGEPSLAEPMKPLQFKIVKNKDDGSTASSSTASDMEIEFSPPAAVSRYRKKPDVVHVDTQVRQQEIIDTYKAEELKKKSRRPGRRERIGSEKKKNTSKVSIKK
ncbi:uncharacterized protein LOC108624784 [Ceratina calcarata]|uniref:Uncharacterized protein LOC108624784 n=1 Tax=Ceratina calcarata TaxID=156304 RepID=A0AAJ7IYK8_9HYME|nr:uncharacterized protein LOC108624784 [Ceratina calcarata]